MSGWTCSKRVRTAPSAPTRAKPNTGAIRSREGAATSPGPTIRGSSTHGRSTGWSASSTSGRTSTWTASHRAIRSPPGPDPPKQTVSHFLQRFAKPSITSCQVSQDPLAPFAAQNQTLPQPGEEGSGNLRRCDGSELIFSLGSEPLVHAEDVVFGIHEPGALLGIGSTDMVIGLQIGKVIVLEPNTPGLHVLDRLFNVRDLETQSGVLGVLSIFHRHQLQHRAVSIAK